MRSQIAFFYAILLFLFSACSQDETTYQLNTKLVNLNCRKTLELEVSPALQGLSYTSLNTNVATVSADGLVTARLVGTTKVVVKDSLNRFVDTVKVVVRSTNTLFNDPYLGFGAKMATILKALNVKDYNFGYPYKGTMIFFDLNLYEYYYYFNENGELVYPEVYVKDYDYPELATHLKDRYNFMVTKRYSSSTRLEYINSYYINPDSSLIILDSRFYLNGGADVEFHPATKEAIQRILSDEDVISLQDFFHTIK